MKNYSYLVLGLFLIFLSIYYTNLLVGIGGVLIIFLKGINKLHYHFFKKHNNTLFRLFDNN